MSVSQPHPQVEFFAEEAWTAAVIGLGYVGLPLLITATKSGLPGIGFDVAESLVQALSEGVSHIDDVPGHDVAEAIAGGALFTTDPELLNKADAIFICVPSPLGRNRQPDLSYIEAAATTIEGVARRGHLILLESTSYPGTTEDIVVPAIERAGFEVGVDVHIAFSPERVSPGDELKTFQIPKVVGGVTSACSQVAAAAYRRLVPSVHVVSSARAAEMTKLIENTYRAVNIGLINEMAQLAHELDIDIWEVIDAAATKPFGFQPFYPGPGVGGHCIPLDPQYLAWRAREFSFSTLFIDVAEQVNTKMPSYNASRIADLLNDAGLPLKGTEILGVGISYKPDITDDRESASLDVLRELSRRGARVSILDDLVGADRIVEHGFTPVRGGDDLTRFQLAAVLTDHRSVDLAAIAESVPIVFDARGAFRRRGLVFSNVVTL